MSIVYNLIHFFVNTSCSFDTLVDTFEVQLGAGTRRGRRLWKNRLVHINLDLIHKSGCVIYVSEISVRESGRIWGGNKNGKEAVEK